MAITDINISEELITNAPSIKYRGEEGPKSPEEMEMMRADAILKEAYEQYVYDLLEQRPEATPMSFEEFRMMVIAEGKMSGGQPLPEDPTKPINPFQPKPIGPVLPDKRQMAAFGGIMGLDGRRKYGLGSKFKKFVRKVIPNEISEIAVKAAPFVAPFNPAVAAAMAGIGGFDQTGSIGSSLKSGALTYGLGQGARYIGGADFQDPSLSNFGLSGFSSPMGTETGLGKFFANRGTPVDSSTIIDQGVTADALPVKSSIPQVTADDFLTEASKVTTKNKPSNIKLLEKFRELPGAIKNNIQKAGINPTALMGIIGASAAAGLYTAATQEEETLSGLDRGKGMDIESIRAEVIEAFKDPTGQKLKAIRTKYPFLGTAASKDIANMAYGGRIGFDMGGDVSDRAQKYIEYVKEMESMGVEPMSVEEFNKMLDGMKKNMADGGRINRAEGGLMDLGGLEKDYRAEGGFVPIGKEEKADDVPARLSVNEFVFTADAVRNAGGGDIDRGAEVMENMMKHLEAGGQVSEESQGLAGARDMFAVSERLSEVV